MADADPKTEVQENAPSSEKLEELLAKAEACVENIGKEGQSLEDAFANYEEGVKLIRQCSRIIDGIEKKMKILQEEDLIKKDDEAYDDEEELPWESADEFDLPFDGDGE